MRIPTWRLALTGGAIAILAITGIGLVAAASPAPVAMTSDAAPADGAAVQLASDVDLLAGSGGTGDVVDQAGFGPRARLALRFGRHLVHAEATLVGKDDQLIIVWLDHGTVQSIGGGTIVIADAGGTTRTVTVDDATIVRTGREKGDLGDVMVGAQVFVQSRVDGGTALAKRILVVPAKAADE